MGRGMTTTTCKFWIKQGHTAQHCSFRWNPAFTGPKSKWIPLFTRHQWQLELWLPSWLFTATDKTTHCGVSNYLKSIRLRKSSPSQILSRRESFIGSCFSNTTSFGFENGTRGDREATISPMDLAAKAWAGGVKAGEPFQSHFQVRIQMHGQEQPRWESQWLSYNQCTKGPVPYHIKWTVNQHRSFSITGEQTNPPQPKNTKPPRISSYSRTISHCRAPSISIASIS